MEIQLERIKIKDLIENYINNDENGVKGFNNRLNIRPKYQREFVYKDKQRDAVIDTIMKDFPLNVMYWVKNNEDEFELLDGQQRTISICEYVVGKFSLNFQYFHNLNEAQQTQILEYELMIYICDGNDSEKLDWFKTINIAGEKLTNQELRNAIYTGTWLTDAKRYFSKTSCPAYNLANKYMRGTPIRQDYLETVIDWINSGNIEEYMAANQNNTSASPLWLYFQNVINWVNAVFSNYRKEMKGINWGYLYNKYKDNEFNPNDIEIKIKDLMIDEDITKKSGIYYYLFTNDDKYLNIRAFSSKQKREVYEEQEGICPNCEEHFELNEMEADHITPWSEGGKTSIENCQMLCKKCNRTKSNN